MGKTVGIASLGVPTVDVWSTPTMVYAGGLRQLPVALAGRPMLLFADERLAAQVDSVQGFAPALAVVVISSGSDDAVETVTEALTRRPGAIPVALGGGSVMDVVRLAALALTDPSTNGWRSRHDGPFFLPTRALNPTVCIPSTLGTGSEVSPVAMRRSASGTAMIISPGLRSAAAIIDPAVTGTLPVAALGAGLVEPWSRVCIPAIAGDRLRFQDGLAAGLGETILALGEEIGSSECAIGPDWLRSAALASMQTHLGLLPVGRAPAGHVLWPLATEVMRVTGLPKAEALAALIPAWLKCLAAKSIGREWGSVQRVVRIIGLDPAEAADRLESWLQALCLTTRLPEVDVDAIATRVATPWQLSGLFLPGVPRADIATVLHAAG